jgi:hypothetical protein
MKGAQDAEVSPRVIRILSKQSMTELRKIRLKTAKRGGAPTAGCALLPTHHEKTP